MLLQILSKRSSIRRMPLGAKSARSRAGVCVCACVPKVSNVPCIGRPSRPDEIQAEVLFCGIPFHSWLQQRRLRVEHVWSNAQEAMVIKEVDKKKPKDERLRVRSCLCNCCRRPAALNYGQQSSSWQRPLRPRLPSFSQARYRLPVDYASS